MHAGERSQRAGAGGCLHGFTVTDSYSHNQKLSKDISSAAKYQYPLQARVHPHGQFSDPVLPSTRSQCPSKQAVFKEKKKPRCQSRMFSPCKVETMPGASCERGCNTYRHRIFSHSSSLCSPCARLPRLHLAHCVGLAP